MVAVTVQEYSSRPIYVLPTVVFESHAAMAQLERNPVCHRGQFRTCHLCVQQLEANIRKHAMHRDRPTHVMHVNVSPEI